MLRAVCFTNSVPALSGSGGATAAYGLGASLRNVGFDVHFAVVHHPDHWHPGSQDFPVHFLFGSNGRINARALGVILRDLTPDVVWIFQHHYWNCFAPLRKEFPHVLYALDPPWEVESLREEWRTPAPDPARRIVYYFRHLRKILALRRDERLLFRQASELGLVIGYTESETVGMARRTGVTMQVCTLTYPDWGLRPSSPGSAIPQVLLLGNMNSTHTRYGLRFFFDRVWPLWSNHDNPPRSGVRVVGGGHLPRNIKRPPVNSRLKWIGFVPSLDEEWNKATALLVPVPLKKGIRARIVEAWSRGVPVIAHPAAENGIPEMHSGENYIAAKRAEEWIEAVKLLEKDRDLAFQIAMNGRAIFERCYSIEAGVERFRDITQQAIDKFSVKLSV